MFTVLHTESSKGWGGQENRILKESLGLRKLGARVIILCQPDSVLEKKALSEGIELRTCRMRKHYDLPAIACILRVIKQEAVDVISTHSGRDSFLAGIAGRISKRKPVIVRTRHIAMAITSRITYSLLPHRVVTTSEYLRQYLIQEGISADKVVTILTGIELSRFDPDTTPGNLRQELDLMSDAPLIGTVAILRRPKGHHILLDAIPLVLKKFPGAVFAFVGDGPQRKNISDKIERLGLSGSVLMLGMRWDIPNVLKSIDLFVLPTQKEAHGGVFVEAMAMERPVIGTDVGGVSEVIKNGINGFLVEPNNPQALAEAILAMLEDRERARLMGMEGRKMVEQLYTGEMMCAKMFDLYASLISKRQQ
ncbi:MAG: glycosyltransferase family 4 protein [Nitrospirae bacterium]|nr:glycosyltransferase family 4 protein [Nitrospirota bacterium]